MPKMDTGIRTQQGADLFSRVNHGQTGIHFTKAVFSSVDLTGKSTDDIRQMTDIEPQELVVDQSSTRLQTLDEPVTDQQQNPETVVRAIAVNDPLTADSSGFYVRTFGLYATDDQGNTVLYGVSLDSHPAYMPQFQGQEQRLAFDWDEDTSDKANIQFTNVHTAYVTWWDFQQFSQAIKSGVDSTEATLSNDNASLASSVNSDMSSGSSALSSHSVSMTSFANSMATSLTNSVNGLPHWNDVNWTRGTVVPSVANSYATSAGVSALNQADANMTWNRDSLNNRVGALPTWNDMNWTRGQALNYAESAKSAAQSHADTGDYNVSLNATNYTNAKAQSALNQANTNMDYNRTNLQGQINNNNTTEGNLQGQITSTRNDLATDNANSVRNRKLLPRGSDCDLNNVTETGLYQCYNFAQMKHAVDFGFHNYGILMVMNTTGIGGGVIQVFYSYEGEICQRANDGDWHGWQAVASRQGVQVLQNQVNGLPTWDDENTTREQINGGDQNIWNYLNNNVTKQINDGDQNLWNYLGKVPGWNDEYYTRGTVAPSLAANAMNQANAYTDSEVAAANKYTWSQAQSGMWNANSHADSQVRAANNYTWSQAQSALTQANSNMEINRRNLQGEINDDRANDLTNRTAFYKPDDLNKYTQTGLYQCGNFPDLKNGVDFGFHPYGVLMVLNTTNMGGGVIQVYYSYRGDVCQRANDGSWHDWVACTPAMANSEQEAQDKSNQHPRTMFIYRG